MAVATRASTVSAASSARSVVRPEVSAENIEAIVENIAVAIVAARVVTVEVDRTVGREGTVLTAGTVVANAGVVIVGAATAAGKPRIRANRV